jgi:hypothetical protein
MPRKPTPEPDLVPVAKAAVEFQCRKRLLLDWVASGQIGGWRFGRQMVYVDRNELRALMRPIPANGSSEAS